MQTQVTKKVVENSKSGLRRKKKICRIGLMCGTDRGQHKLTEDNNLSGQASDRIRQTVLICLDLPLGHKNI